MELIIYIIFSSIAIGIFVSAPMGPVGMLCVQRTLSNGRWTGFYTGVGAAISDLFYCMLAGFGLSLITDFIEHNLSLLKLVGSVVLIVFAIYVMRKRPQEFKGKEEGEKTSHWQDVATGFFFTVSNPLILFLIIGLFARYNFPSPDYQMFHYLLGYGFIAVGAILWWCVVSYIVDAVRYRVNLRTLTAVNRIIGIVIMIMAIMGLATSINELLAATIY